MSDEETIREHASSDEQSLNDCVPEHSESDTVSDMELAYREALAALDAAEVQVGTALVDAFSDSTDSQPDDSSQAVLSIGEGLARDLQESDLPDGPPISIFDEESSTRVSPREVIEAALFVGGDVALTARRLASLIGQDVDSRIAVKIIDQLNEQYARENRPYEIQLHEGGFQLQLREEFARLQSQVHGMGPREVRLSPEALELLAFVAWNQPVDGTALNTTGHERPMTVIRQLIRLQLVEVERVGKTRDDVVYRTTQRFSGSVPVVQSGRPAAGRHLRCEVTAFTRDRRSSR